MANVSFPRSEIEKHIKLTPEAIEKMQMMGIPAELSDDALSIEVLVSRPDLISMQGFLRAYNAYYGKDFGLKKYSIKPSGFKIIVDKSVDKVRPYCMAAIVKGLNLDENKIKEIMQWQEKIHATVGRNRKKIAIGYYMLDKIKFPVYYTAKAPKDIIFEPLDMPEKMDATKILQRHPTGREYAYQLEGFDKFPVYYDSNKEVLSLPPIINSNNSGKIIPGTKDVLIEASGTDLSILKRIITMAVADLLDIGGKAFSIDISYSTKVERIDFALETMKLCLENVNKAIGLELKEKDLERLLPKMGYEYKSGKVSIPAYRTDILHEVDIIEDIAIAYGYGNLVPEIPIVATIGQESHESKVKFKISSILTGLGLLETSSYHLIKKEEAELFNIQDKIETENAKTDYKILRPNLLIPALRILAENKDNEYPQKVFELGAVFRKSVKAESGIAEQSRLLIASTPGNFTELKQTLDYLFKMLKLEYSIKESINSHLIEGRTGEVLFEGKAIGYMGEVHPQTLRNFNIKLPIAIIEISLDEIISKFRQ